MSLQASGSGPDLRAVRNRRRRKTLGGIFTRGNSVKDNHSSQGQGSPSQSLLSFPKRKSISISPRVNIMFSLESHSDTIISDKHVDSYQ
jgi:hypothetical protein